MPDDILEELELTGRLAGSKKNRVKAIKLRGVLSQGILYPATTGKRFDSTHIHWRGVTIPRDCLA